MGYQGETLLEVRRDKAVRGIPQLQTRRRLSAVVQGLPEAVRPRLQLAEASALGREETRLAEGPCGMDTRNEDRQGLHRLRGVFPPEAMQWDHLPGSIKLG